MRPDWIMLILRRLITDSVNPIKSDTQLVAKILKTANSLRRIYKKYYSIKSPSLFVVI